MRRYLLAVLRGKKLARFAVAEVALALPLTLAAD
jgi:hypothetical protein